MIGGWQGDYDSNSLKRSFYEIDFNKLGSLYLSRSSEQFFDQDLTSNGSFKSETKRILGKCLKMLRKYLLPEVMLLTDTHVISFFNNAIKFTQIEHLYLLSTPDAELNVQTSPLTACSLRRFVIFILGAHLMFSFAQKQDSEDFKTVRQLMVHLVDCFQAEFKGIFASFHRATSKDSLLVENLSQLNIYLKNFEDMRDHKEYKKICAEAYTISSQDAISSGDFSPPSKSYKSTHPAETMKSVRIAAPRIDIEKIPTTDSPNQTFVVVGGNDNRSMRSDLLSESNSIRSMLLEKKTTMNQVRMQGLTYSKIKNTFFDNSMSAGTGVNNSFSSLSNSPAKLRFDMGLQNSFQDTTADTSMSSTVQYMKNTQIYPRLLGDLKQHNELKGLKLIKETHVFSKGEEKDYGKKNSPLKERFYKTKEEEDNINPFSIIDVHASRDREVEVTINEVQKTKLKVLEEEKLREELLRKKAEEKEKIAAKVAKEEKRKLYENAAFKEEDEDLKKEDSDLDMDVDEMVRQRRRTIKRSVAGRRKGITQDNTDQFVIPQQVSQQQIGGDSSPLLKSGLLKPEAMDYQKPTIDYLEKTERVFERPSDFPEEEITEYCFKKVSAVGGRKAFLTKLLGEKVYEKVYNELNNFYDTSALKTTGNNHDLKPELLSKLTSTLENRKIKNFAKATANRESVYYLLRQKASLAEREEEVDEEVKVRVRELWGKVRTAIQMKGFIKRLSNNEISVSFVNLQNNRIESFLPYFDRNMQEDLKHVKFSAYINNRQKEISCVCRMTKKKENRFKAKAFQGVYIPIKSHHQLQKKKLKKDDESVKSDYS